MHSNYSYEFCTSAGVPTNAPMTPAVMPRAAFIRKPAVPHCHIHAILIITSWHKCLESIQTWWRSILSRKVFEKPGIYTESCRGVGGLSQ